MKLEDIWSSYRSSLKAFLHSKISNPSDVDDLLQEILIKTHNSMDDLKKGESIKSWLFQIANRTTIDFYRKNGRLNEIDSEDLWYGESEYDVKTDLSHCIEPFLKALPEEVAELLRSVDLGERSQKAYAQELGISYSTLKSRVQKGRSELQALFEDCCHYSLDKQGNLIDFEQKSDSCKKC
ncbi:RNA polymerase sigma factor SigZ [uncultured Shewanella sp.]|uniref:RNA polymerase sigma factor SigZ n=1 Tax=uncultured Shewanella sp. TaxID=173975 RepID=UPI0026135D52|nr:RNA polymerase sigma factor SigZ [uncultured Shewanella sp.]